MKFKNLFIGPKFIHNQSLYGQFSPYKFPIILFSVELFFTTPAVDFFTTNPFKSNLTFFIELLWCNYKVC